MAKQADKRIMQAAPDRGVGVFGTAVGVLAFAALFLLLATGMTPTVTRQCSVLLGCSVVAVILAPNCGKRVAAITAAVLCAYTVLCVAIGFGELVGGLKLLVDGAAKSINFNRHAGLGLTAETYTVAGDYIVWSMLAVWLGFALAHIIKCSRLAALLVMAVVLFVMLCVGLYPSVYAVLLAAASVLGLIAANRGYALKAALTCFGVGMAIVLAAMPCLLYGGSAVISELRDGIATSAKTTYYGGDSLPDGRLERAVYMRGGDTVRLKVTMPAQVESLYLKGFVGSEFSQNRWYETDKNLYVENGYQGLMQYMSERGFPAMQYARYAELGSDTVGYSVSVENVAASARYMYLPYTVNKYTGGEAYYDMNVRSGERIYEYTVLGSDKSGERTTQAQWLFDGDGHSRAMLAYIAAENEYRAFVHDTYTALDEQTKLALLGVLGNIDASSVNTVAQVIRAYFLAKLKFGYRASALKGDFMSEFLRGGISTGNSPYFATAATVIFRVYGYAARYVEGYLVKHGENSDGTEAISVTDKNAHAWTEVYFDGIGWLPIEVTPTFFAEEPPEVLVDPDAPDATDRDESTAPPETPDDDVKLPIEPDRPDEKPRPAESDSDAGLFIALKILLPIASLALALVSLALVLGVRRFVILERRHKKLGATGADFGRAAYGIMETDCKRIGGFSIRTLGACGVDKAATARFVQLIEKSVYGEYDLGINEKNFVMSYIDNATAAVMQSGGQIKRLFDKYIRCLGI